MLFFSKNWILLVLFCLFPWGGVKCQLWLRTFFGKLHWLCKRNWDCISKYLLSIFLKNLHRFSCEVGNLLKIWWKCWWEHCFLFLVVLIVISFFCWFVASMVSAFPNWFESFLQNDSWILLGLHMGSFFYPPPKRCPKPFLRFSSSVVMMSCPKVHNTIPDRSQVFLCY